MNHIKKNINQETNKPINTSTNTYTKATDGEFKDIKEALGQLGSLPCDVVIRLCTDEIKVLNYWNAIDQDLEFLTLDVLDDTAGEGVEVRQLNP
eukprot:CAMPEP_0114367110 /NCGR_PEP_ID=MMETSP0101-20121206/29832_1 /TAXON_ID=38822 ORGANISM="Pteridomonas danica, Strain PT" /NCGR_SAMPLE_ID=MMETSP0101 /ASSEMBLY_ACC=CAM_ASM_000211 /LENGTH=93 /DNA_ID=CAMNT_0001516611 /DNA_START=581 /DNA_END=858 /DNA_ORIENTATION=+